MKCYSCEVGRCEQRRNDDLAQAYSSVWVVPFLGAEGGSLNTCQEHARRLRHAGIMGVKTLEEYDWSFNPKVPRSLIADLATDRFVRGGLLIGTPGTGKSHLAIALTVAAIQAGHTALYRSALDLAQDMAEATGTSKEVVTQLCKVDLLVLEDLGMKHLPPTGGI
jgi:DNA replication protein DnaC